MGKCVGAVGGQGSILGGDGGDVLVRARLDEVGEAACKRRCCLRNQFIHAVLSAEFSLCLCPEPVLADDGTGFPHRIFTHLEDDSVLDAPLVEVILVPADVRLDLVDLSRRDRRQWC